MITCEIGLGRKESDNGVVTGGLSFPEQMRCKVESLEGSAVSQGLSENQYFVLLGFGAVGESAKQVELTFLEAMSSK